MRTTPKGLRVPPSELVDVSVSEEFPDYDSDEWEVDLGDAYESKPVSRALSSVTVRIPRDMRGCLRVSS